MVLLSVCSSFFYSSESCQHHRAPETEPDCTVNTHWRRIKMLKQVSIPAHCLVTKHQGQANKHVRWCPVSLPELWLQWERICCKKKLPAMTSPASQIRPTLLQTNWPTLCYERDRNVSLAILIVAGRLSLRWSRGRATHSHRSQGAWANLCSCEHALRD